MIQQRMIDDSERMESKYVCFDEFEQQQYYE